MDQKVRYFIKLIFYCSLTIKSYVSVLEVLDNSPHFEGSDVDIYIMVRQVHQWSAVVSTIKEYMESLGFCMISFNSSMCRDPTLVSMGPNYDNDHYKRALTFVYTHGFHADRFLKWSFKSLSKINCDNLKQFTLSQRDKLAKFYDRSNKVQVVLTDKNSHGTISNFDLTLVQNIWRPKVTRTSRKSFLCIYNEDDIRSKIISVTGALTQQLDEFKLKPAFQMKLFDMSYRRIVKYHSRGYDFDMRLIQNQELMWFFLPLWRHFRKGFNTLAYFD